jgi:nucleotide-binding universal stress UspA family protein
VTPRDLVRPRRETRVNFDRLLVPVDFSPTSLAALGAAKRLASRFKSEILLLHVIELLVPIDFAGAAAVQLEEHHRHEARTRLERLEQQLVRIGIRARSRIVEGSPARAIVDVARKERIGTIVMGTHGAGGFTRFVVGSVTDRVVRSATCPVLTVRSTGKTATKKRGRKKA